MTDFSNSGLMCGCAICAQQGFLDSGANSAAYTLGTADGINHPLKWGTSDTLGTAGGVVTWSIVAGGTAIDPIWLEPGDDPNTTGLSSFLYSGFEQQLRDAFAAWAAVANINFIQVVDGGGAVGNDTTGNFADIRILATPFDGPNGTLALTFFPDQGSIGGDMILDATDGAFFNPHSLFLVAAHEIGHAIGLDHADPATNPGSLMNGIYNDSLTGLTADDTAGAQAIYGAAQPGTAKTYTMPDGQNSITIVTGTANLTVNGNSAANTINGSSLGETINGGAGNDTINAGAGDDYIIASLSDGNDTYTGGNGWDILDFTNVPGVVQINQLNGIITGSAGNDTLLDTFEQIYGSNFDDVLSGGHGINCLDGNGGNDIFFGNGGDDLLRGGDGDDTIYCNMLNDGNDRWLGGNGFDTIDYSLLGGAVQVNMAAGTTSGAAGNDTFLDSFEQIIGSNFADTLIGDSNSNTFRPGNGNDTVSAGDGDDFIFAALSDGNDTYTGGNGWDILDFTSVTGVIQVDQLNGTVTGSAGSDTLLDVFEQIAGSNFNDILSGGHGPNVLDGNGGDDTFYGNGGDDLLRGGDGNDTIMVNMLNDGDDRFLGGNGFDTVDYSTLGGAVQVDQATGTTSGAAGNDTFQDVFERIIGSNFADTLTGEGSANTLWGGGGNDTIQGNGGADTLLGGSGNDTFIFTTGDGADTIGDFVAGAGSDDVINLHSMASFTSFAQVQAVASQVGANTVLNFGGGDSITLTNVTASTLHQDDFIFV